MFTPPVLSAFNRWRRLLDISVAIESISTQCKVDWVFARTPKEAAEFIRLLGDHTEEHTDAVLRPHLWDSREWVLDDPTLVCPRGLRNMNNYLILPGRRKAISPCFPE
jgi:hypothetical protein